MSTVVATFAARAAAEVADGIAQDSRSWYVVARDWRGAVTGAAMRTARFAPRPLFVLPMPGEAARELARALHARGEVVAGANGALPAVRTFADEAARLAGGRVLVDQHTRLFELADLVPPARPASGRLRAARLDEAELCLAWIEAFAADADEQAGRPAGSHHDLGEDLASVRRRIEVGRLWLWEDDGEVVHLTGTNPPAFGVVRVGPVYTRAGTVGAGTPAPRWPRSPAGSSPPGGGPASSPTRPTRPRTPSTNGWATSRWSTWSTSEDWRAERPAGQAIDSSHHDRVCAAPPRRDLRRGRGRLALPLARDQAGAVAGPDPGLHRAARRPAACLPGGAPDRHQRQDLHLADDRHPAAHARAADRAGSPPRTWSG